MVIKVEIIKDRLQHMKAALDELKKLKKIKKEEFIKDKMYQWSVERGFHIVCEAVFDIGNHILVSEFNCAPSNYQSVIDLLNEKSVISDKLRDVFRGLGGFRNILVHDYLDLELDGIFDKLQNRLGDFDLFIQEVAVWIKNK